mmetsp:Transcript_24030/g.33745  ORF Transcript_24030/g.33745 Transcript_24030/m.33745 type:complete len:280 (+) Transcript_24030:202-1041(+)
MVGGGCGTHDSVHPPTLPVCPCLVEQLPSKQHSVRTIDISTRTWQAHIVRLGVRAFRNVMVLSHDDGPFTVALYGTFVDGMCIKEESTTTLATPPNNVVVGLNVLVPEPCHGIHLSFIIQNVLCTSSDLGGMSHLTVDIIEKDKQLDSSTDTVMMIHPSIVLIGRFEAIRKMCNFIPMQDGRAQIRIDNPCYCSVVNQQLVKEWDGSSGRNDRPGTGDTSFGLVVQCITCPCVARCINDQVQVITETKVVDQYNPIFLEILEESECYRIVVVVVVVGQY